MNKKPVSYIYKMSEHEEFKTVLNAAPEESMCEALVNVAESVGEALIPEHILSVEIPAAHEETTELLSMATHDQSSEPTTFFPEPTEEEDVEMTPILSESATDDDVKTLAKMVAALLTNGENETNQLSVSPEVRSILAKLMDRAECLGEIETSLKEIIKDGKIDANDVPQIMLLLTSVYNSVKKFKLSSITTKNCGDALKVLVDIAVKEELIVVKGDVAVLLSCLSNIIDSSIQLMQMKDAMPEIHGLFKCIKNLFRKF